MRACRLANANECTNGGLGMRYIVVCNVHEGIDPDLPIVILDALDETYHFVAEIVSRLPDHLAKRFYGLA